MRLIVTGAEGFVGRHLLPLLLTRGHEVVGTYLDDHPPLDAVDWQRVDLASHVSTERLVDLVRPEGLIHLAAISHVPAVQAAPDRAFATNVTGLVSLLGAMGGVAPATVVVVSSGEVYGRVPHESLPVDEQQPVAPHSLYGVSKACSEQVAWYFGRSTALQVTVVRPFSQLGPGQSDTFVCSSFARQIARVMLGKESPRVQVGNLAVRRDFMDVRDVVHAYSLLAERYAGPGPYNLCTGKSISIGEIVGLLIEISGMDIRIDVDQTRVRPVDIDEMIGDPSAFHAATGWRSERPVRASLEDTLQFWLDQETRFG